MFVLVRPMTNIWKFLWLNGLHPAMLAEKLHICHSISMPQFRKTHGIPVYLSNVVLAKLQTHHQSWLTCSQPGKPQAKSSFMLQGCTTTTRLCVPLTTLVYPHVSRRHRQHMQRAKTWATGSHGRRSMPYCRRWFWVRRDRCAFYRS